MRRCLCLVDLRTLVRCLAVSRLWARSVEDVPPDALIHSLQAPCSLARCAAARALGGMGAAFARHAAPALAALLVDPEACVRDAAAMSLWRMGRVAAGPSAAAIAALLAHAQPGVRLAAVGVLGRMGPAAAQHASATVAALLQHPEKGVQLAARQVWGRMSPALSASSAHEPIGGLEGDSPDRSQGGGGLDAPSCVDFARVPAALLLQLDAILRQSYEHAAEPHARSATTLRVDESAPSRPRAAQTRQHLTAPRRTLGRRGLFAATVPTVASHTATRVLVLPTALVPTGRHPPNGATSRAAVQQRRTDTLAALRELADALRRSPEAAMAAEGTTTCSCVRFGALADARRRGVRRLDIRSTERFVWGHGWGGSAEQAPHGFSGRSGAPHYGHH